MAVTIPSTGTEYAANAITITRGTVAAITGVGVFHTTNAATVPTVEQFTTVDLVQPGDPLADGQNIDVLSLIGPDAGDVVLTAGVHQRWVLIQTATENIIRKVDTVTVI